VFEKHEDPGPVAMDQTVRLDGWKKIAAHFKRDRSTVIRWAQHGLPVHRVPGSRVGSVFAYTHELDAWLALGAPILHETEPTTAGASAKLQTRDDVHNWRLRSGVFAAAAIGVALFALILMTGPTKPRREPVDPADATLFLKARNDWASRTPAGLRAAIDELRTVIRREPRFAPAYAGLADAYILSCEFDTMPQGAAFANAENAARSALAIDPGSADANRAMGFVTYWGRRDIPVARRYFHRALRADPTNAQTHFWFGNTLVDNGEIAAGLAQLREARALNPDSAVIQADYAWSAWQNGSDREARDMLGDLAAREPMLRSPQYFLALIDFADGDIAGYLDHAGKWAALQHDAEFAAAIAAQKSAYHQRGAPGALDVIASSPAPHNIALHVETLMRAMAAAKAGRRDQLIDLLKRAEANREEWEPLRWQTSAFAKWRRDPEVNARLIRLFAPSPPAERMA
jgi:hypothetical protein